MVEVREPWVNGLQTVEDAAIIARCHLDTKRRWHKSQV
jgi:hypothetical protein